MLKQLTVEINNINHLNKNPLHTLSNSSDTSVPKGPMHADTTSLMHPASFKTTADLNIVHNYQQDEVKHHCNKIMVMLMI